MDIGQIRQGDVLLEPVEGIPRPSRLAPTQEHILAYGELTGHAHRLRAETLYVWEADGQTYVQVVSPEPGTIQHEDHDPDPAAVVAPGIVYQVIPQQQVDLSEEWSPVLD